MFKYINKCYGISMRIKDIIEKIGKKRIDNWIFIFCLGLTSDGIFQFIYFWFQGTSWVKSTAYWINEGSGYNGISFSNYLVWFTQVYFCLFIPLIVYLGFKYKNIFNGKKIKGFSVFSLSCLFIFLTMNFHMPILIEWISLFMIIYIIMILKFNIVFSLSFSILCFQVANMLWEMGELNTQYGTILSYILVYSIFIFVLYKLKVKINLPIILSFIPVLFSWIYFYPLWHAWSTHNIINYTDEINKFSPYFRLFVFPFLIIITLQIYFNHRKYGKP